MSFVDALQGYRQIPLAMPKKEKTAFLTPIENYHYRVMPFGFKNARSTYQRMAMRMFEEKLGKNVEAYIDDIGVNLSNWKIWVKSFQFRGSTSFV